MRLGHFLPRNRRLTLPPAPRRIIPASRASAAALQPVRQAAACTPRWPPLHPRRRQSPLPRRPASTSSRDCDPLGNKLDGRHIVTDGHRPPCPSTFTSTASTACAHRRQSPRTHRPTDRLNRSITDGSVPQAPPEGVVSENLARRLRRLRGAVGVQLHQRCHGFPHPVDLSGPFRFVPCVCAPR